MSYSSKFQQEWLTLTMFQEWIMKHESPFKAYCNLCSKAIDLSNIGKRALTSHAEGKSHKKAASLKKLGMPRIEQFVKLEKKESDGDKGGKNQSADQEISATLEQQMKMYITGESVVKAEILWAIKSVISHFSFRVSSDITGSFQNMFPDRVIAKNFACGKTKNNYLICFGIAPYFREKLLQKINKAECLTVSFDECLNTDFQKELMDIAVHYFHEDRIVIQYFDSQFLGHTTADDLLNSLKTPISKLNNRKILQISMDGPRGN